MTLAWLLTAIALALLGGPGAVRVDRPDADRAPMSPGALSVLAAVSAAGACVALFGVGRGLSFTAVAAPSAVLLVRRAHDRPTRTREEPALPLALDLTAVALRAGQPVDAALILAAPAAGSLAADLTRVGRLLRLGADPTEAWGPVGRQTALAPVAAAACRSAASGIRLADAFEAVAIRSRADRRASGQARAHRVGVLVAAPLGLCFLPAFVCVGIVPALIGLADSVLH